MLSTALRLSFGLALSGNLTGVGGFAGALLFKLSCRRSVLKQYRLLESDRFLFVIVVTIDLAISIDLARDNTLAEFFTRSSSAPL